MELPGEYSETLEGPAEGGPGFSAGSRPSMTLQIAGKVGALLAKGFRPAPDDRFER